MNKRVLWGWLLISVALLLSVYANYTVLPSRGGIWMTIYNPLAIIGLVLYAIGTYLLLTIKK